MDSTATPVRKKKKGKFEPGGYALKVRRSSAGLGLYALERIPKGSCIIEYVGRRLSEKEYAHVNNLYLFEVSKDLFIDGSPRTNTARYINHSCKPNCEVEIYKGRVFIMAKRTIKAGEELAYDYGEEYFGTHIKPYGCRCAACAARAAASA
jgi:hypothetical protein